MAIKDINIIGKVFSEPTGIDLRLLNILCKDHLDKLKKHPDDPGICKLYNNLQAEYDVFTRNYAIWVVSQFSLKFEIKRIKGLIDDMLSFKIYQWDRKIQKHFAKDSKEYSEILSEKDFLLKTGNIDDFILKVKKIYDTLVNYPKLKSLRNDIYEFYSTLKNREEIINKIKCEIETDLNNLKKSGSGIAETITRNYGYLTVKYSKSPRKIKEYFDLELINNHGHNKYSSKSPLHKANKKETDLYMN